MFALNYHKLTAVWLLLALGLLGCTDPGTGLLSGVQGVSGTVEEAFAPGQTGRWLLEQDAVSSAAIVSEQLVITVNAPNTIHYATLAELTVTDFSLEVDVRQRAGDTASSFGVLFRLADASQFYRFDITGNGSYIIERRDADGTWTRLIPEWKQSPAINPGLNVANRLKVIATGSDMTFYVNDILLEQISDSTYSSGRIALDAGTFGNSDLQVSFDDLLLSTDPADQ